MKLEKQNVLFFARATEHGGTENVILQLCEILNPCVNKIVVCSADGFKKEELFEMNINFYSIPDIEKKDPITLFKVARAIKKIVEKENITVIHVHHRMAAFYVSLLRLYDHRIFIATSHNTFYNKRLLTRFAYNNCNVIACGEMVKRNLVDSFGLDDDKVKVIHNAVKPFVKELIADPLVQRLHDEGMYVVANVGRLSEQKGMEYFIKAIPKIIDRNPNVRFVIAGAGEDEMKLKKLAHEIKLGDYLYFLGYRNDIQNLMSQVDLVVLSSLWEGLPLTPIEAFSVGKTIVATAVDGTVEIVDDGIDGLLIPPKDISAIAEKVIYLLENPAVQIKFEQNAKCKYFNEFSFNQFAKNYINFYEGI